MNATTHIEQLLTNLDRDAMALHSSDYRSVNVRLDLNCLSPQAERVIGYTLQEAHGGPNGLELRLVPAECRCPNCGVHFHVAPGTCDFTCPECGR